MVQALRQSWTHYLDGQHRYPTGMIGRIIGERMIRQHAPETAWTLDLLKLTPTDRVLELGCGAGHGIALVRQHTPHIIALDLSLTMLKRAAKRNHGTKQALVRADIGLLPFHGQHFDKIFSIHTFYFWADQAALCAELFDLLAPHGRCVITFATARTASTGERVYWQLHHEAHDLVDQLNRLANCHAVLATGPDSRQFNNVAIVLEKRTVIADRIQ